MKQEHEVNGGKVKKCSKEVAKIFIHNNKTTNIQIVNNYNYQKETGKSIKSITLKITHYMAQLEEVKRKNKSVYELVPISYSDDEIVEALEGLEDALVLNVLSFVNETRLLASLLKERADFCEAKGFRDGMPILHVGLNTIDRNIGRIFETLTDKRNIKIAHKLKNI